MEAKIGYNGITEGVIWKQLLSFFFPILLGTFFQQLYNTVDAIVVGQYLGKEALAAVGGGTGTAINLLIGFFTGLSSGASVVISQHYGAKNDELVAKSVHTATALAIAGGVIITILGLLFSEPLLIAIGTPEDILPLAVAHIQDSLRRQRYRIEHSHERSGRWLERPIFLSGRLEAEEILHA